MAIKNSSRVPHAQAGCTDQQETEVQALLGARAWHVPGLGMSLCLWFAVCYENIL